MLSIGWYRSRNHIYWTCSLLCKTWAPSFPRWVWKSSLPTLKFEACEVYSAASYFVSPITTKTPGEEHRGSSRLLEDFYYCVASMEAVDETQVGWWPTVKPSTGTTNRDLCYYRGEAHRGPWWPGSDTREQWNLLSYHYVRRSACLRDVQSTSHNLASPRSMGVPLSSTKNLRHYQHGFCLLCLNWCCCEKEERSRKPVVVLFWWGSLSWNSRPFFFVFKSNWVSALISW